MSTSSLEERYHQRFRDADWYSMTGDVVVGGAGSIGSWLCLLLARMGCKIALYEMDSVEEVNLGGQLYSKNHIGGTKSNSIDDIVRDFSGNNGIHLLGEFIEGKPVAEVTFSCFDNMKARKDMFSSWKDLPEEDGKIFIDGRLTAESFQIFSVTPGLEEQYQESLFDDEEVEELPCSFKSTTHIASMIASVMATTYTNFLTNRLYEKEREVPFKVEFQAPLMMFSQEYPKTLTLQE